MSIAIKMPALSPTMETGTLAKWTVKVGDDVRSGDVIAEIETDKATMEVEAVDEGVVAVIAVEAGSENVPVGAVIAMLAEDGEDAGAITVPSIADAPPASPPASPPAKEAPLAAPAIADNAPAAAPVTSAAPPAPPATMTPGGQSAAKRVFATPLARRIAADAGFDLAGIAGSGPYGRILRHDVDNAIASGPVVAVGAPAGAVNTGGQMAVRGDSELVPNSQMRKVIASRLQQSKQEAPHFYLTVDCEIDALLAARKSMNEMAPDGVKISVNDLVIRAAAMALIRVPAANASWEGDNTRLFKHADIAMAVAVDGGLVTPVIWAAEQKGLADIAATSRDLATRARDGTLDPSEYAGGSFTISNLGMFGVREFAAVINPPQGAILAVGAGEQRPIVKDGALAVATVMTVTLSADHRAVDGAVGAQWLQAFKGFVENPVTMLL